MLVSIAEREQLRDLSATKISIFFQLLPTLPAKDAKNGRFTLVFLYLVAEPSVFVTMDGGQTLLWLELNRRVVGAPTIVSLKVKRRVDGAAT